VFGRLLNYCTNDHAFPHPPISISSVTPTPLSASSTHKKVDGPYKLVEWAGEDDPEKPMNWPNGAKFMVMLEVMILNFSFYAASAIFTPSIPGIEEGFGVGTADGTLGLSLFVIAYGIGPLIVGPLDIYFEAASNRINTAVTPIEYSFNRPHSDLYPRFTLFFCLTDWHSSGQECTYGFDPEILGWACGQCTNQCWRGYSF